MFIIAYQLLGTSKQETAGPVCPRFDCQECGHSIYTIRWPQPLQDFHGVLRSRRPTHSQKDGGDAKDVEGPCPWIYGYSVCFLA